MKSIAPLQASSKSDSVAEPLYGKSGIDTPWYKGWDHLSQDDRDIYRQRSVKSSLAKKHAELGQGGGPVHPQYSPRLDPSDLMPQKTANGLRSLSLFSGGGGMDLGFDRAGYEHIASYELLPFAGETLKHNRPTWNIKSGPEGDVTKVDWTPYRGLIDVIHGGPPCQPFSTAGHQAGKDDARDMFPEFVRAVLEIMPLAFVAENVPGLSQGKFASYVNDVIVKPLSKSYDVKTFFLSAASFGVPQNRRRMIFVGIHKSVKGRTFSPPTPTHTFEHFDNKLVESGRRETEGLFDEIDGIQRSMGVREALGLPEIGFDTLSPTLRCTLTGPRHTTSVISSVAAQKVWSQLKVWPNGVAANRSKAQQFVAGNGHYRLSVPECALLQGFPETWQFGGAVYKALGQIGNSVAPPMAYAIGVAVSNTLRGLRSSFPT